MNRRQIFFKAAVLIALFMSVFSLSGYTEEADAAVYYVAPPEIGNDLNPGTPDLPFATIQHAINVANSGDAVSVATGVYNENIIMKAGVSVIGESCADSSIVGTASIDGVVLFDNVLNAVLKGFRITVSEPDPGTDRGVVFQGTTDNTAVIQNCIITDTQYGIFVWAPAIPSIVNNTLVAINDEQGIYIGNTATAPVIRNNIITGYSYAGIHVIAGTGSPTPIIEYNDVFNNGWDVEGTQPDRGDYVNYPSQTETNGNISSDPDFFDLDNGDFHLNINSPCIDAGNPAFQYNDYDGTRNDMGAFGGPCTYLSPMSQQVTAAGGAGFNFNVLTSLPGCFWTANSTSSWIINVSEYIPGETGNGTVTYDVSSNSDSVRQGIINVGGQTFTVTQDPGSATVSTQAGQGGSISPTGITVNFGETALFTVTPDDGYHTVNVSGCGVTKYKGGSKAPAKRNKNKKNKKVAAASARGEIYITGPISENCTISASFAINTFTVTPKAGAHGSIDPSTPLTVNYHDTVSFTVNPDAGYHIKSVTGCGIHLAEGGTYITDPIASDCTVEAVFLKDGFTVTILKSGTGSGTVTGNGITCGGSVCAGTYEAGYKLTLMIKPDAGYRLIDVKINGKSIGPVQTITLKEIMSNFTIEIVFGPV